MAGWTIRGRGGWGEGGGGKTLSVKAMKFHGEFAWQDALVNNMRFGKAGACARF